MFRKATAITAAATVLLSLSSAAATQPIEGKWRPTQIGTLSVAGDTEAFVSFADFGRISGHGGCNRFFGSFETRGDSLEVGPLGATQMACPEAIMEHESQFLRALRESDRFNREGSDLVLMDEAGEVLMRLVHSGVE